MTQVVPPPGRPVPRQRLFGPSSADPGLGGDPAVPSVASARRGWRSTWRQAPWSDLLASWLTVRLVVLGALLISTLLRRHLLDDQGIAFRTTGLLGWDADWYRRIAEHGYDGAGRESLRFFPLFPLLVRAVAWPLGGSVPAALLLLANLGALAYAWLLHRLALREGLGEQVARRAIWALALAPAGFVLVMGYTEALYGVLVVGVFLAARDRNWLLAALLGLLAGASRPTGLLLALPVLVEALRALPGAPVADLIRRITAIVAPAVGLALYLGWVGWRYGDPMLPFTLQAEHKLRGGTFVNPIPELWQVARAAVLDDGPITLLVHLPAVLLALVLLVVVARRLPISYLAFAVATLALALTARRLSSFERYAGSAVPLLLAAALMVTSTTGMKVALVLSGVAVAGYSLLAFTHLLVP